MSLVVQKPRHFMDKVVRRALALNGMFVTFRSIPGDKYILIQPFCRGLGFLPLSFRDKNDMIIHDNRMHIETAWL